MTKRRSSKRRWMRGAGVLATALLAACGIDQKEEAQLGDQYATEIQREVRLIRDPALVAQLDKLGQQLARRADRTGRKYTFYLVDSPEVNAFAIPGGHIFVNRGLIESADQASEFAGVLGHEIAHVTQRHGIKQMEKRRGAGAVVTLIYVVLGREPSGVEQVAIQAGGAAVFARYGRNAEREADQHAVQLLPAAGYDPEGVATFFEDLLEQQQREPGLLDSFFASHPTSQERVQNARALIQTLNVDTARLADDTPEYRAFRAAVLQRSGKQPADSPSSQW